MITSAISQPPVAVVTGASRGIGLEVCRQLATLGYVVLLGSRDPRAAELAAKELDPEGERVIPVHVEADNSVNIGQLAEWVHGRYGRVDAIVNNASTAPDLRVSQALLPLLRDGILVNAVCPGPVSADGARSSGRSAAQGAASVVWAVTLPNGGPTGTFTRDGRELPW
ncbi:MAG TPA: SDR family NAD(P)-dependent oxidoreductase [Trebonia sp.]|nr:SDR family NAD(P)-dependent oxidoreductase [Trebonia sp.]